MLKIAGTNDVEDNEMKQAETHRMLQALLLKKASPGALLWCISGLDSLPQRMKSKKLVWKSLKDHSAFRQ